MWLFICMARNVRQAFYLINTALRSYKNNVCGDLKCYLAKSANRMLIDPLEAE